MLTVKQVNKAIAAKGIQAELVRGNGYFYFTGDAVARAYSASVPVYTLNELSLERWLQELDAVVTDSKSREPL